MDINALYNISSPIIQEAYDNANTVLSQEEEGSFKGIFQAALDNLNTTNTYLSDAENEQLRFELGEAENTHDLTIALQKASTALQYTVAVRDKFLEAYNTIMQIQI